jgi:hypothetical protein
MDATKTEQTPSDSSQYTMDIETTIVDKLGVKLYDKVSAVVAELVANSYDADAENVEVKLPLNKYLATHTDDGVQQKGREIIVRDDGHGMTPEQANNLFLRVGRDRREDEGQRSREKNRPVMGRKGIGKLAPFGICDEIEIKSAGGDPDQDQYEISHFLMDYEKITDRSGDETEDYKPTPLEKDGEYNEKRGTVIRLRDFNVKKVPTKDVFERKLGQRFATGTSDFNVRIEDNKEEEPEDPFFLSDSKPPLQEGTEIDLDGKPVEHGGKTYSVEGWMGLAETSYQDEFGGVKIYVRGKLASNTRDFGLAPGFTGEFVARSYLIGEVHADWLDQKEMDLIQTHRQDILWDSELGSALSEWGKERVKEVASSGQEPRRKKVKDQFVEKADLEKKASERYNKEGIQEAAVELGESLGQYAHEDELEFEEYLEDLTNFVLQIAPHKYLVDMLQEIRERAEDGELDVDELIELFESTHIAEITSFGQVARNKVNTINVLEEKINDYEADEDDLHSIVENSPWLVEPSWQPLTSEKSISTIRESFEEWYEAEHDGEDIVTTTETDYEKKRPDFVMLEMRGAVRVVEIKRPDYEFGDEDFDRFANYVDAFEQFFESHPDFADDFPNRAKFTLIADGIDLSRNSQLAFERLRDDGPVTGRKSWHELLKKAKEHHQHFLEAKEQVPEIEEGAFSGITTTEEPDK